MVHVCVVHILHECILPFKYLCTGTLSVCAAQVQYTCVHTHVPPTRVFRIPYSHILYTVYIFSFTVASGSTRSKSLTAHNELVTNGSYVFNIK